MLKNPVSMLLIVGLGLLAYADSWQNSFHYDDNLFILTNSSIRHLSDISTIWHYFHGRFITFLSLALNYHFNGLDPVGYHLFNLMVHLAAALALWQLVVALFQTPVMQQSKLSRHADLTALLAALIFVAHPIQTEAVTYIWQRAASMTGLFTIVSVGCYVQWRLLSIKKSAWAGGFYWGALLVTVIAMFTKENAVSLPLMILAVEFYFFTVRERVHGLALIPLLVTCLIIPITLHFLPYQTFKGMHGNLMVTGHLMTPMHYRLTEIRAMFSYIRLVFLPLGQNLDHDYPLIQSFMSWPLLLSVLGLAAIVIGMARLFKNHRLISFGIFWFFLTLAPESFLTTLSDTLVEHRLYLPMAGAAIAIVSAAFTYLGRRSSWLAMLPLLVFIGFLSGLTYERNKVWKNDLTLWNDVVQGSPRKARAYNNRGKANIFAGHVEAGVRDFKEALALYPDYSEALSNLATAYMQQGDERGAVALYSKAIVDSPTNLHAVSGRAKAYYLLHEYDLSRADVRTILKEGTVDDQARVSSLRQMLR